MNELHKCFCVTAIFVSLVSHVVSQNLQKMQRLVGAANGEVTDDNALHLSYLSWKTSKQIAEQIRLIPDSETGAIDASGKYVKQKDASFGLNCSGFAKWVADGYYYPLHKNISPTEPYLSIKSLKQKRLLMRGDAQSLQYEVSREPFFALDWSRNIANTVAQEIHKKDFAYTSHDVTSSLWAKYVKNRGFPISKMNEILMEQTALHPNRFYIASINGMFGEPPIVQHYHVAVIFSYYFKYKDGSCRFFCDVFERNKKTSYEYLLKRYPDTYFHLVWLEVDKNFQLTLP